MSEHKVDFADTSSGLPLQGPGCVKTVCAHWRRTRDCESARDGQICRFRRIQHAHLMPTQCAQQLQCAKSVQKMDCETQATWRDRRVARAGQGCGGAQARLTSDALARLFLGSSARQRLPVQPLARRRPCRWGMAHAGYCCHLCGLAEIRNCVPTTSEIGEHAIGQNTRANPHRT